MFKYGDNTIKIVSDAYLYHPRLCIIDNLSNNPVVKKYMIMSILEKGFQ